METFSIEAMVRGYHVYQDIWNATVGEELYCQREFFLRSTIFADGGLSAKTAKIMRLENLALYGTSSLVYVN